VEELLQCEGRIAINRRVSSRSLLSLNSPRHCRNVGGYEHKAEHRRPEGQVARKAVCLRPIIVRVTGLAAENFFPDPWKVGDLASKDRQGGQEAM
jgi:hypothetical protein